MNIKLEGRINVNEAVFLNHFTGHLIHIGGVGLEDQPQQERTDTDESH